jgi:hypothetical protein
LIAPRGKVCRHHEWNYPSPNGALWRKPLIHKGLEVGSYVSTSIAPLTEVTAQK